MKIREKLVLTLSTAVIVPLLIVIIMVFRVADSELKKTMIERLEIVADLKVDKIESFFRGRREDIEIAKDYYNVKASLPVLIEFGDEKNNPKYLEAKKALDAQLKILQEVYNYKDVMLTNANGEVVYVTNNLHSSQDLGHRLLDPDDLAFKKGSENIYFSNIFRNPVENSEFFMLITAPIYSFDREFVGVIVLEEDMRFIYDFIQDVTGLGETGETLIGQFMSAHSSGGTLVHEDHGKYDHDHALFLNPLRHDKEAALERTVSFDDEFAFPMQNAVQGLEGSGSSVDYRSEPILAAWRHIPSLNWGLVAKMDTKEALEPLSSLQVPLLAVGAALFLFVIAFAFWVSKRLSLPVQRLAKLAGSISRGNLDIKIEGIDKKDEIGTLANGFRAMVVSLRNKEKEKAEFITSASHQLRTPSSGVMFQLQSLKNKIEKGADKKEVNNILSEIIDNNGRVVAITNDLFKILELGDNYFASNLAKANAKENVTKVVESYKEMADGKKLDIIIDVPDNIDVSVEFSRAKEAFINLVDNAIKYSNEGGEVKISAKKDGDMIKFEISDKGIGIPAKEQIHVFDKFFRASNSYLKASVGSGLGLTIVKTIIEGHGGEIGFESKEGEGSTFWFTLPSSS